MSSVNSDSFFDEASYGITDKLRLRAVTAKNIARYVMPPIRTDLQKFYLRMLPYAASREGFMSPLQSVWYNRWLSRQERPLRILEIGFNLGHSACAALSSNAQTSVTSVEIGVAGELDKQAQRGAGILADLYPDRHQVIIGDSREVLADGSTEVDGNFDVVFVDGGHDYDTASADIVNSARFSHQDTKILLDDYNPLYPWGIGPFNAWNNLEAQGIVARNRVVSFKDGRSQMLGRIVS